MMEVEPLRVRMVEMDHYMHSPLKGLDVTWSRHAGQSVERVPVVRVFGTTPKGQKACLHIHQVRGRALPLHVAGSDYPLRPAATCRRSTQLRFSRTFLCAFHLPWQRRRGPAWKRMHCSYPYQLIEHYQ